ncbi:MAG: SHOCT domain-containing protein [Actinobacteria bacterium]|nr:MAG: SHOCT domain-containing protein [Actinomycetota bacterium]
MCPFCGSSYGPGYGGGFGLLLSLLFIILFFAGVALLIWWIVRMASRGGGMGMGGGEPRRDRALEILNERYARGEIGKEEYDERRRGLGG